ncbi:MAG: hypothetical protein NDJ89_07495 [Oligoflexia bacterium]|nr:hypothetical protein [Oligoflexia bacterium]
MREKSLSSLSRSLLPSSLTVVCLIWPSVGLAGPESPQSVRAAVNSGHTLVMKDSLPMKFGDSGALFLQNGRSVAENALSGDPYCKLMASSMFQDYLEFAPFQKDQEVPLMEIEFSDFSLFGFKKTGIKIKASTSIQNASATKRDSKMPQSTMELSPLSLHLNMDCKNFKGEPSIEQFRQTLGEGLFVLKKNEGPLDIFKSIRQSDTFKQEAAKKAAKEEEEKRLKLEAEKKRLEDEAREIGVEASSEAALSSLTTSDGVQITAPDFQIIKPNGNFTGSLYQGGKRIGASDVLLTQYTYKGESLDAEKPRCTISPTRYRSSLLDSSLPMPVGAYEITENKAFLGESARSIDLKVKTPLPGAGVLEANVLCFKVKTVGDVRATLGDSFKFLQANPDAKAALEKAIEGAAAASTLGAQAPAGELPQVSGAEAKAAVAEPAAETPSREAAAGNVAAAR